MYGISGSKGGSILIDGPEGMDVFRMLTLEGRLKMEMKGLHFRGSSARTLAREWYGLRGSKQKVLDALVALRHERYPLPEHEHTWGPFEQTALTGATIQRCTNRQPNDEACDVVSALADE